LLLIAVLVAGCSLQSATIKDENSRRKLADDYYHQKEYDKAKNELQSILIQNPNDIQALFLLGVIYGKQGSTNASCHAFKKTISIDPYYSKAYYNLGVLYAKSKTPENIQNSIKYFDKFLELEPETRLRQEIEQWKFYHLNQKDVGEKNAKLK
jgi:tetratricopeptide (TPR) repeat protein